MKYSVFKLRFSTAVHFGNGSLSDGKSTLCADTIFSALCCEALALGGEGMLGKLVGLARENRLLISDGLPYIQQNYYIPKPIMQIEHEQNGDPSSQKKAFKKLKYLPVDLLHDYLDGELDPEYELELFGGLGKYGIKSQNAVAGLPDTEPFNVGVFSYSAGCGLYVIVGSDGTDTLNMVKELFTALSYSGIGGERSNGMGKFSFEVTQDDDLTRCLTNRNAGTYVTLSACMAKDGELDACLDGATYSLIKRSGYVYSSNYADTSLKKRDMYLFAGGSCFRRAFEGDVFDVSHYGGHKVYRYAKPMLMGVDI